MKVFSSPNAVVEMSATTTKHKIDFKNEEVLNLLRKRYPDTIPDEFLQTMIPAFILGVEQGLKAVGYRIEPKDKP